jgi:hypothetical protein
LSGVANAAHGGNHPEVREEYVLKNLRKAERLGYDLDRVLMVDDEAHKPANNHGSHIPIESFTGTHRRHRTHLGGDRYFLSVSPPPQFARYGVALLPSNSGASTS